MLNLLIFPEVLMIVKRIFILPKNDILLCLIKYGGLGIGNTKNMNLALLVKQVWRIMCSKSLSYGQYFKVEIVCYPQWTFTSIVL